MIKKQTSLYLNTCQTVEHAIRNVLARVPTREWSFF